jgi:hypothetical protein
MFKTKLLLPILIFTLSFLASEAQNNQGKESQQFILPTLLSKRWEAQWIVCREQSPQDLYVTLFRKALKTDGHQQSYIIHVSAEQRYKLYINGTLISLGPALSDPYNWNYETVDIARFLHPGENIIAAVVWSYNGPITPLRMMGKATSSLIIQGNSIKESGINTDYSWQCMECKAYKGVYAYCETGYSAVGPGEQLEMEKYPMGWMSSHYDSKSWEHAVPTMQGSPKGTRDTPEPLLVPRSIPFMELTKASAGHIRSIDNKESRQKAQNLTIAPYSHHSFLLDADSLQTAYLDLILSGGKGSKIIIGYAESLYTNNSDAASGYFKGNRNDIKGKKFIGLYDHLFPDGKLRQHIETLDWKTWRYLQLDIETQADPLQIDSIWAVRTCYPLRKESSLNAGTELARMEQIGWRTARLCANETYMDCPYYERLQYFGDTRIQAMITMYNTRDTDMVRNAIHQGQLSLTAEGITQSRYPSAGRQMIPSYSLSWIGMLHDYWMLKGDSSFVTRFLPAVHSIISWYEHLLLADHHLKEIPFWYFTDWNRDFPVGEAPRDRLGRSAIQDLDFIRSLDEAAELESHFGMEAIASHYRQVANTMRQAARKLYWDPDRQLFADTYEHDKFSQHTNIQAILSDIITGEPARQLCLRLMNDTTITPCSLYYRSFLFQAMDKAGCGDLLLKSLEPWRAQIASGLTTWAETPDPARSDCHAWSACLNIEFYRILLGIHSITPGFKKVLISPHLCGTTNISGRIPVPQGTIETHYKIKGRYFLAEINLPIGINGTFAYHDATIPLHEGKQTIKLKN